MKYEFVIPDVDSFVSGGNLYNKAFVTALSKLAEVKTVAFREWKNNPSKECVTIIDSIYIDDIKINEIRPKKNYVLLLHYLDVFFEQQNSNELLLKRLEQLANFDYFIVTGKYSEDWLMSNGVKKENIFLLNPMISIDGAKLQKEYHLPLQLLMIGNFVPVKGYVEFLQELDVQQPADILISIIGDGNIDIIYANKVKEIIDQSVYLKHVCRIIGTTDHKHIAQHFQEHDLLISASYFETFGMAIHEALLFGMPVLALPSGNITNIQHPFLSIFETHKGLIHHLVDVEKWHTARDPLIETATFYNPSWDESAYKLHTYFS